MEKCQHVSKIRPAWDHSILNPEKWMCYLCKTTESVWACLSCSNVACGRFNEKHALNHFQESKHPISIEVNEKYVYCYACDDYVFNDNAAGDIKLLRSALSAVATQKFTDIESRGRRLLRSYSHTGIVRRDNTDESDKLATAEWHQRQRLLAKTFLAWRSYVREEKAVQLVATSPDSPGSGPASITMTTSMSSLIMLRKSLAPGVTGLRNLGNTCYMNSVLQVLSHIEEFRDFFLKMRYTSDSVTNGPAVMTLLASASPSLSPAAKSSSSPASSQPNTRSSDSSGKNYKRQTTVECFQHLMSGGRPSTPKQRPGGLNGGSTQQTPIKQQLICDVESTASSDTVVRSLCAELHGLFRVLWSSKWAQVSPHAFLRAVWQAIPMFKGYAQHDAQEFLCELLDKIQRELDASSVARQRSDSQLLNNLFQGQLVSQVTCLSCDNVSSRFEPYLDLSLEFPDRYQITKQNPRIAQDICHITEMLAKFTEEEHLEGAIYACEKCNKMRRKSLGPVYTEAKKQFLINQLPPVLRLHLKRFRWSGRDHREKISTHVAVDEELDLRPFCSRATAGQSHKYRLFGVIIHHGKGFGSGHYTAYTWNKHADSWVNCNDSRMILSSLDDVLSAQAYILFYRDTVISTPTTKSPPTISVTSSSTSNSSRSPNKLKTSNSSRKRKSTPLADSDSQPLRRSARRSGMTPSPNLGTAGSNNSNSNNWNATNGTPTSTLAVVEVKTEQSNEKMGSVTINHEVSFKVPTPNTQGLLAPAESFLKPIPSTPLSGIQRSSLKRLHDTNETDNGSQPLNKSAKKLSFGTDVFYSTSPNKLENDVPENSDKVLDLSDETVNGDKVDSSMRRRTGVKEDLSNKTVKKLSNIKQAAPSNEKKKDNKGTFQSSGERKSSRLRAKSISPAAQKLKLSRRKLHLTSIPSITKAARLKRRRSAFW